MSLGLVGRKVGMTRVFTDDGNSVPETVVDVDDVKREAELWGEGAEHVEESDGVGAARHGDQDSFAAPEHPGAANGVEGERAELSACGHIRLGDRPRLLRPRSTPSSRRAPSP